MQVAEIRAVASARKFAADARDDCERRVGETDLIFSDLVAPCRGRVDPLFLNGLPHLECSFKLALLGFSEMGVICRTLTI